MPSNPITPEEQYDILINRSLTPRDGVTTETYMAAGYILMPPATVDGPVKWRLFDAAYIQTGIIDPNRLGTGATGAGNLYLADDGTWKAIGGGGGGGDMYKATYDVDNDGVVDSAERTEIIVRNSTGSTLTKGTIVYLSGATGNRPNALRAQAHTEATSSRTIGIVEANIANNSDGYVATNGTLHDLDTSAFTAGDAVWLSATTAGAFTSTIPAEPNHTVFIGYIARAHPTQGRIVLHIQNGYELNELHGVQISSEANNDLLVYESSTTLWKNKSISTIFGGTPLVSIPTLAQVTTAGNTTTNAITVGSFNLGSSVGISTLSAFGLNYFIATALTAGQGISASFSPSGTPTSYAYNFQFSKSSTANNNSLLFIGGGASAGPAANKHLITTSTDGTATAQPLAFAVATGNWASATALMTLTPTQNVLIGTTTDAGYKLDVNGTARVQGALVAERSSPTSDAFYTVYTSAIGFYTSNSYTKAQKLNLTNAIGVPSAPNNVLAVSGSITAASALAQGVFFNNTLVAAANNDVLVGLDINPTFTNGAFTGVTNTALRVTGNVSISGALIMSSAGDISAKIIKSVNASNTYINLNGTTDLQFNVHSSATNGFRYSVTGGNEIMRLFASGNLVLQNGGTFTDAGYKLDVNGTARVQGAFTATLANVSTANVVYYNSSTGLMTYATAPIGAQFVIDYDYNIVGLKNGSNVLFTTSATFIVNTTRVFLNGQRLTRGAGYDYIETGTNQITFTNPPVSTDLIIIEYQI
jgi:hypothetical protein